MMSSSIFTSRAQKVSMELIMVTLTTPRQHIYNIVLYCVLVLVLVQLTVVIEPLYSGLEAAGLVDGAGHHGLAAHDVLAHGELGQVVGGGARLERDVSGVRQLELHCSLARAAH